MPQSARRCVRPGNWTTPTRPSQLIRNLARRLEQRAPGIAASIAEGLDEILTVIRLGLPAERRRSAACSNITENIMGTVRRVCHNVKRWQDAAMALHWTSAAMLEAVKGFAKQLSALRTALAAHRAERGGVLFPRIIYLIGTEAGSPRRTRLRNRTVIGRAKHRVDCGGQGVIRRMSVL
jgi:hypothetical protein